MQLDKTDDATVQGNSIGIGADGTSNVGVNSGCPCSGIKVMELAEVPSPHSPLIGGDAASDRNLIGNGGEGVWISDGADGTEVRGNWIGVNAAGGQCGQRRRRRRRPTRPTSCRSAARTPVGAPRATASAT